MNILDEIVRHTRDVVARKKRETSRYELEQRSVFAEPRRDFAGRLRADGMSIIAEAKRASPSRGIIRSNYHAGDVAESYEAGGAAAISVLTEEAYFQGALRHMEEARTRTRLPVLRKDFLIDPYQIVEARAFGADAVLLIAAVLDPAQLHELHEAARELDLAALVEIYDPHELERLDVDSLSIVGANNRDLRTFEVDLHRSISVLSELPESIVGVSESGISTTDDLALLVENGIDAALIGESFMRSATPGDQLKALLDELAIRLQQ